MLILLYSPSFDFIKVNEISFLMRLEVVLLIHLHRHVEMSLVTLLTTLLFHTSGEEWREGRREGGGREGWREGGKEGDREGGRKEGETDVGRGGM